MCPVQVLSYLGRGEVNFFPFPLMGNCNKTCKPGPALQNLQIRKNQKNRFSECELSIWFYAVDDTDIIILIKTLIKKSPYYSL